jgi:hypothetical protein
MESATKPEPLVQALAAGDRALLIGPGRTARAALARAAKDESGRPRKGAEETRPMASRGLRENRQPRTQKAAPRRGFKATVKGR